ncbi:MAG: PilZ domain-containing protein [Phycisphaerae bacterium]|jgi:hypothetical protein
MLATIDLNPRQTKRVLEQALRNRAHLDIETRCREQLLSGTLISREGEALTVRLEEIGEDCPLPALVGAFCDIRTVLSGNLYTFSTCIMDARDDQTPPQLSLAAPDVVRVANRRKFDRFAPEPPAIIQLWLSAAVQPVLATMTTISSSGLGCRAPRADLEPHVLIDDEVRVCFQLPQLGGAYEVTCVVCTKTRAPQGEQLEVGFEFLEPQHDNSGTQAVERLRAALSRSYLDQAQTGGEA